MLESLLRGGVGPAQRPLASRDHARSRLVLDRIELCIRRSLVAHAFAEYLRGRLSDSGLWQSSLDSGVEFFRAGSHEAQIEELISRLTVSMRVLDPSVSLPSVEAGVGGAVTGAVLGAGAGSALTAMDDPNA